MSKTGMRFKAKSVKKLQQRLGGILKARLDLQLLLRFLV